MPLDINYQKSLNINQIKKIFIDFVNVINDCVNCKLINDINKMSNTYSFVLNIENQNITIHFISNNNNNYISVILHAINTFCNLVKGNYDGLNIYVCLDSNERTIYVPKHITEWNEKINYLKKNSAAFTVSGVTYFKRKKINCNKK